MTEDWESVMTGIDWENDFDADNSDIEDIFPENISNSDELNLSITSTELYNEVGHLFDYQNTSDEEDDEPLIVHKKAKKEASRTELWIIDNEFQFAPAKPQPMAVYENEIQRIASKSNIARFFYYFPQSLLDQMTDFTGRKIVESGYDMHVSKPILIKIIALGLRMNFYRLPSVNHYFSNSIGDITIKHTLNRQTFYRLRAHLKCVVDGFVEQETKKKDPLWKIPPDLNSISECMQKIPCPPDHCCVDKQIIPFSGGMPNKVVINLTQLV